MAFFDCQSGETSEMEIDMICATLTKDYRSTWNEYSYGYYTPSVNSVSDISLTLSGDSGTSGTASQSYSTPSMKGTINLSWANGSMTVVARVSGKFAYSPNWTVVEKSAGETICTGFRCVFYLG